MLSIFSGNLCVIRHPMGSENENTSSLQKVSRRALYSSIQKASHPFRFRFDGNRDHHSFIIAIMRFYLGNWVSLRFSFAGPKKTRIKWPSSMDDWYPNRSWNEDEHLSHFKSSRSKHSWYYAIIESSFDVQRLSKTSFVVISNVFECSMAEFFRSLISFEADGPESAADGELKNVYLHRNISWKTSKIGLRASESLRGNDVVGCDCAFEMVQTSDQLFTQQHRSTFPSKIEIYEMKQKSSQRRVFALSLQSWRREWEMCWLLYEAFMVGVESRREDDAFERQPNE